jgi:predicted phage terminase large subunit-like protein
MVAGLAVTEPPSLRALKTLSFEKKVFYRWQAKWTATRRKKQTPPPGDWTVWLLLAGRGFGKTRTAAETLAFWAWVFPNTRWLVSGRTTSDMRSICFEGDSGLLSVIPRALIKSYNKSLFELTLVNGSLIKGISAEEPEAYRGQQFHGGWCDELAAWQYMQAAWDMIMFGMRLKAPGIDHPKIIVSTTPKPKPLIRQLARKQLAFPVAITIGSSKENFTHLASTFQQQLMQYANTRLGSQEIDAVILDDEEGGVIRRSWLQLWPARLPLPRFDDIIFSLDTAFTEKTRNVDKKSEHFGDPDPTAGTVWGVFQKADGRWGLILLDAWEDHLGLPDLIERVKKELKIPYGGEEERPVFTPINGKPQLDTTGQKISEIVIEDKGSGISLRQMLAREKIVTYAYNPGKADKLARLHGVSHMFANGFIYVPESVKRPGQPRDWCEAVIDQLCTFRGDGTIAHDDYVDSTTQALRRVMDKYRIQATIPKEKINPEDIPVEKPLRSYYG